MIVCDKLQKQQRRTMWPYGTVWVWDRSIRQSFFVFPFLLVELIAYFSIQITYKMNCNVFRLLKTPFGSVMGLLTTWLHTLS
jgi:hypothetical protein